MKKFFKVSLIVAGLLIFLGGGLMAIGYANGGIHDLQTSGSIPKKEALVFDKISDVNLDVNTSDVIITTSSDDKVHLSYYKQDKSKVSITEEAGKLTISHKTSQRVISFFRLSDLLAILGKDDEDYFTIILSLPKNSTLNDLSGRLDIGDLSIEGQSIKQVNLNQTAGDAQIKNSQIDSANLSLDAGDIEVTNSQLKTGKLELAVGDIVLNKTSLTSFSLINNMGDINAENLTIEKDLDISLDMGDVDIELDPDTLEKVMVNAQTDMGESTIPQTSGNEVSLKIITNMGDIEVR